GRSLRAPPTLGRRGLGLLGSPRRLLLLDALLGAPLGSARLALRSAVLARLRDRLGGLGLIGHGRLGRLLHLPGFLRAILLRVSRLVEQLEDCPDALLEALHERVHALPLLLGRAVTLGQRDQLIARHACPPRPGSPGPAS